jgi:hypothetical protein
MVARFGRETWSLVVPDGWRAWHGDECATLMGANHALHQTAADAILSGEAKDERASVRGQCGDTAPSSVRHTCGRRRPFPENLDLRRTSLPPSTRTATSPVALANGMTVTVRKEGEQTSFSVPILSSSKRAVGAQAMFPNSSRPWTSAALRADSEPQTGATSAMGCRCHLKEAGGLTTACSRRRLARR